MALALCSGDGADGLGPRADVHDRGGLHPRHPEVRALAHCLVQHTAEAIEDDCTLAAINCGAIRPGKLSSREPSTMKLRSTVPPLPLPLYIEVWSTLAATPRPTAYFMTLFKTFTSADAPSGAAILSQSVLRCRWRRYCTARQVCRCHAHTQPTNQPRGMHATFIPYL